MELSRAQNSMKIEANKKRRDVELTVGEMVYLKAQLYKWKSLAHRPNEKLIRRFYGLFALEERVGKICDDSKIRKVKGVGRDQPGLRRSCHQRFRNAGKTKRRGRIRLGQEPGQKGSEVGYAPGAQGAPR
ncbi:hypothetical protein CR513_42313, partial [Mucuna pruriens]